MKCIIGTRREICTRVGHFTATFTVAVLPSAADTLTT